MAHYTLPSKKEPVPPWLHDLLKPHVVQVLVCDPRKNTLGKVGNKNDRNDARELAELLYIQPNILGVIHEGAPCCRR